MSEYTIIEDCSPFYIRYSFTKLYWLINLCKSYPLPKINNLGFNHIIIKNSIFKDRILDLIPASKNMQLNEDRISFFLTEPNFYYGPHKDGLDHRFSLNFPILISDDKCITSWYSDDDLQGYEVSTTLMPSINIKQINRSREILNWKKNKHIPIKTLIVQPNEAILFNTEIFHDFDNSNSNNRRLILTLRHKYPGSVYFEDARKILFGY